MYGSGPYDTPAVIHVYVALIWSRIEYGGFFLFDFHTKDHMDLLEKIQCEAFGYVRITPKNVMLAEAEIPPITF
jgi:hypothetical protein